MRKKIVLTFICIAALLLIIFVALPAYENNHRQANARKASDTFASDVVSGKGIDSYSILTDDTKKAVPRITWTAQVARLTAFFNGAQPKFLSSTTSPTLSTFIYELKSSQGTYTLTVKMVPAGGKWQVHAYSSALER